MDELFNKLPSDNGIAFLEIERYERGICDEELRTLRGEDDWHAASEVRYAYMNKIRTAAEELCIEAIAELHVPRPGTDKFYDTYFDFRAQVDATVMRLQIGRAPERRRGSVELSADDKTKIHDLLGKIRRVINEAENLDLDKKNALIKRLAALALEVDKNRTDLGVFSANMSSVAKFFKDNAHLKHWVEDIWTSIATAKEAEDTRSLPAPRPQKKLAPPKKKTKETFELDDEIPF